MLTPASHIALFGFGASAVRIAAELAPRGQQLTAFDPRLQDAATADAMRTHIEAAGIDPVADPRAALRGVRLVIVDQPAQLDQLLPHLRSGQLVLDLTCASSGREPTGMGLLATGVHHLAGQMAADVPLLWVSGLRATELASALQALGLRTAVGNQQATAFAPGSAPPGLPAGPTQVRRGELP